MALACHVDLLGHFEHTEDALFGKGGGKDNREVCERSHAAANGILKMRDGFFRLVLNEVPLVHHHHEALVVALDDLHDVEVLAFDAARGVDEQDADVGVLDSAYRAHHGVELEVFGHLVLAAYAGGVDQEEVEAELVVARENTVARGAGNIGDDVPVLTDECVDQAALSGIRSAHDGEAGNIFLCLVAAVFRTELLDYDIEQIARSAARGGRDTERLSKTEGVKLGGLVAVLVVVRLVAAQDNGHLAAAQDTGHGIVEVGHAVLDVGDEKYEVGLFGGEADLLAYFFFKDVVGIDHPAAGIDE